MLGVGKMTGRSWINFARYSSPPIGKARCLYAVHDNSDDTEGVFLHIKYDDGYEYEGWLKRIHKEAEEE